MPKLKIKRKGKLRIKAKVKPCEQLQREFKHKEGDIDDPDYQQLLRCMSDKNRMQLSKSGDEYKYLYPILDDSEFNYKISAKKEFYDTRYEKKSKEDFNNIKEIAQKLCDEPEFELDPHQMFVRNFMSFQTPYN